MLSGRTRGRSGLSPVGLALITCLVLAQGLQAAALRACPHHGAAAHAQMAAPAAGAASGTHDMGGTRPSHDTPPDGHPGPCDCLGPCGTSAAVRAPAPGAESVRAPNAPRTIGWIGSRQIAPALRHLPFALPYPNAPPA